MHAARKGKALAAGIALVLGFLFLFAGDVGYAATQEADNRPAIEVYKNLRMENFRRMSKGTLDWAMNAMNTVLGVECTHCHEQDNWANDNLKPEKVHAREMLPRMWEMVGWINSDLFKPEGLKGPACWTCHRGSVAPPQFPSSAGAPAPLPVPNPFVDSEAASGETYRNIQVLKSLPASTLAPVMQFFVQALGVECSHCHVEEDWASDEKTPKQTARKMLGFVQMVKDKYFENGKGPSCWTCHRGSNEPERNPPR